MVIPPPPRTPAATGSHFYRYASFDHPERLEQLMLDHAIYIPSATQLNDLRDARPRLRPRPLGEWVALMKGLSPKGRGLAPPDEHARIIDSVASSIGIDGMLKIASQMAHDMMTKFRIYSMSKRWDNLSMWEWYGGKHAGYCLEFANTPQFFAPVREVVYDNSFVIDITDDAHGTANWLFYKSPDWSNEEEVRLVLPHRLGPFLKLPPEVLTRVILGKDMVSTNADRIKEWGSKRVPPVPVVIARWDPFRLSLITD
ncbi:MAG: DUF2971 domain-containing protein [Acidobacteriota bacterium]